MGESLQRIEGALDDLRAGLRVDLRDQPEPAAVASVDARAVGGV